MVITIIVALPTLDRNVRTFVAVSGIVLGNTMTGATLAGRHLNEGLRRRRDEIEAWLSIGASNRQAVRDVARAAASEALVPGLDQTRTVGLVTLPGAFIGALLGGASAVGAARFQIVVLVGLLCAQVITVSLLTYLLGAPSTLPEPAARRLSCPAGTPRRPGVAAAGPSTGRVPARWFSNRARSAAFRPRPVWVERRWCSSATRSWIWLRIGCSLSRDIADILHHLAVASLRLARILAQPGAATS